MKTRAIVAGALLLAAVSGCGEDSRLREYREVVRARVQLLEKTADTLATVKDRDSMPAALRRLRELGKVEKDVEFREKELGPLPRQMRKQIKQELGERVAPAGRRYYEEMLRINALDGGPAFFEELKKLQTSGQP